MTNAGHNIRTTNSYQAQDHAHAIVHDRRGLSDIMNALNARGQQPAGQNIQTIGGQADIETIEIDEGQGGSQGSGGAVDHHVHKKETVTKLVTMTVGAANVGSNGTGAANLAQTITVTAVGGTG